MAQPQVKRVVKRTHSAAKRPSNGQLSRQRLTWMCSVVGKAWFDMQRKYFSGKVQELIDRASRGTAEDVDYILGHLTPDVTLAVTKFVDYALSLVESTVGVERVEYYLFNGTQIQRNYCSLFFNRRGDWPVVKKAYERGLIDEIQAYAR